MSEADLNSTTAQSFEDENLTMASTRGVPPALHPYGALVFAACFWVIVAVLGITGNTMVILAAILSKHVRTTTNVLVVNLSVADLFTCLALPWTSVARLSDGTWPIASLVPCQIAAFMWHTGLGTSLYNLALIALNRLVRITRPLTTYNRIFSPRKMVFIVALSWLIPIFVVVFPPAIGVGGLGYDLKHRTCTDEDFHPRAHDYNLAQSIGFYPIPMTTVIISYIIIYIHVKRHFRNQLSRTDNDDTTTDVEGPTTTTMTSVPSTSAEVMEDKKNEKYEGRDRKRTISRQQIQITKNLFWVFCAFTLCISPYFISLFFRTSEKFAMYGAAILICNSCVNPIIYGAKHPQFKKVLRPMLRCKWRNIPEPSKTLQAILSIRQNKTQNQSANTR